MSTPYRPPPSTKAPRHNCFQASTAAATPPLPDLLDVESFPALHAGDVRPGVWGCKGARRAGPKKERASGPSVWWETAPPGWMLLTPNWGGSGVDKVFCDYGGDSEHEEVIRSEELRQQWLRDPTRRHIQWMQEKEALLADIGDMTPHNVILFQQRVEYEPPNLLDDDCASSDEDWQDGE